MEGGLPSSSSSATVVSTSDVQAPPSALSSYVTEINRAPSSYWFSTALFKNDTVTASTTGTEESIELIAVNKPESASSPSSSWSSALPTTWNPFAAATEDTCFGLSFYQRFAMFFACFAGGCIMLFFAVSLIPMLLLGFIPKFAVSYLAANVLFIASSGFLVGPKAQFAMMFDSQRWPITLVYLISLIGTLYAAWQVRVFYVLIPLLIVQFVSLIAYVGSYLPFGVPMVIRMFRAAVSQLSKMIGIA